MNIKKPFLTATFFVTVCIYAQDSLSVKEQAEQYAQKAVSSWLSSSRNEAVESLRKINPDDAVSAWEIILDKSRNPELKIEAIANISKLRDRRNQSSIIEQLDSEFSDVRLAAISILKKEGDDRVYPKILQMSQSDNPVFRVYAAEALTYLYDKRFLPIVTSMIKDENKSIRLMIIKLIAENRIQETLTSLKNIALQDADYEVVAAAAEALSAFNDSSSGYIYIKLLSHSEYLVRKTASAKIARFRISSAVNALNDQLSVENNDYLKNVYMDIIVSFRTSSVKGIEKIALTDSYPQLRIKAVAALGNLRSERSSDVLIRSLSDPDSRVRAEACNSLALLDSRKSTPRMVVMLKNENDLYVRTAALYALEKIRDKSTIIPIYDILYDEKDPFFRMLLNNVLRRMIEKSI